jgi:hypothetical protein
LVDFIKYYVDNTFAWILPPPPYTCPLLIFAISAGHRETRDSEAVEKGVIDSGAAIIYKIHKNKLK